MGRHVRILLVRFLACCACCIPANSFAADDDSLAKLAERAAAELPWLDPHDALYGRETRWGAPSSTINQVMRRFRDGARDNPTTTSTPVIAGAQPDAGLRFQQASALLKHHDPKVRTLGIILLFEMDRADILPDVALLIADQEETFPQPAKVAMIMQDEPPPMLPASVSTYAKIVIDRYVESSDELSGQRRSGKLADNDTKRLAEQMRAFVAARDPRFNTATMRVAMERATGRTTPLQPQRAVLVRQALSRLERVSMPRRFFVALAIEFDRVHGQEYNPDYPLTLARLLPRDVRLATVRGERALDDLDLAPGFGRLYLLDHAADLFRSSDAQLLLDIAGNSPEKGSGGTLHPDGLSDAKYFVAAGMLRTDRADEILMGAFDRFKGDYETEPRQQLATALAQYGSMDEGLEAAIDWFFKEQPQRGAFGFGREAFLERLGARSPLRYRQTVARVCRDPRLTTLGPASTRQLLLSVQGYLGRQLADEEQVRSSYGIDEFQRDRKFEHLGQWHQLLRETVDEWDR